MKKNNNFSFGWLVFRIWKERLQLSKHYFILETVKPSLNIRGKFLRWLTLCNCATYVLSFHNPLLHSQTVLGNMSFNKLVINFTLILTDKFLHSYCISDGWIFLEIQVLLKTSCEEAMMLFRKPVFFIQAMLISNTLTTKNQILTKHQKVRLLH